MKWPTRPWKDLQWTRKDLETTYNKEETTWNNPQQDTTYNDLNLPTTNQKKMQNNRQQVAFEIILQYGANGSLL